MSKKEMVPEVGVVPRVVIGDRKLFILPDARNAKNAEKTLRSYPVVTRRGVNFCQLDMKVFEESLALNLRSGYALARTAVPEMLKQGHPMFV